MGETYTVWWIDDEEEREKSEAATLEEQDDRLNVWFNSPEEVQELLASDPDSAEVDLILVDWKLDKVGEYYGKGLSMEGVVRESFPKTPIYGFSSEFPQSGKNLREQRFDGIYDLSDLNNPSTAADLIQDIDDYNEIQGAHGDGIEGLFNVLRVPEDSREQMRAAIPREFSEGLSSDPNHEIDEVIQFGRWVRTRLLRTPGPLWNDLWTSTKLGLDIDIFDQHKDELREHSEAEYNGVFSHRTDFHWWSDEIIHAVVNLNRAREDPIQIGEIARAGPELFEAEDDDIATCTVCDEKFPESVAAVKQGEDAKIPVHYRCSEIHHSREGPFEEYRVINQETV